MKTTSSEAWLRTSLLDRLTDEQPEERTEASIPLVDERNLRRLICRDLRWLLSTTRLTASLRLDDFPEVARSVVNFGIPDLAGRTLSSISGDALASEIAEALVNYESRLVRDSIRVRVLSRADVAPRSALFMEIEAVLRTEPLPLALALRAQLDLETGEVVVVDDRSEEAA